MTWPTGQEYSDTIQSPRSAFEDAELQRGNIETDRLGLPRPRSGNFAVVYKIDCGMRSWAVKCFTREVVDQQKRYAAISAHLRGSATKYTVAFDYLAHGIRIRGQWFPILKMEWVSGDSLIRYIESHVRDPGSLLALGSRWVAMVKALRAAGIAHGDLQHGNVLVVGGELKLVDYDGMFVPSLAGASSGEMGHPNYQHPGRGDLSFGPDLDNFSAWSIYVSLIAVSIDPALWSRVNAGDDCLLFRASDLVAPERSQVFRVLAASSDEGLRSLTEIFRELLRLKAEQVPPLDAAKIRIEPSSTRPQSRSASWLDDYVIPSERTAQGETSSGRKDEAEEIDASWVLDFVTPAVAPKDARFTHGVLWLRLTLLPSMLLAIVALFSMPVPGLSPFVVAVLIGANLGLIAARYRTEPGVVSLRTVQAALAEIDGRSRAAAARVMELERERRSRSVQRDRDLAAVEIRTRAVDEQARGQMEEVKRRLDQQCAPTQKQRRRIDAEEQEALIIVARSTGAPAGELRNQLRTLAQEEAREFGSALAGLQSTYVKNVLSAATVAGAQIPNVGPHLKRALITAGIVSAQDVDRWKVHRISRFGPTRVNAVVVWANAVTQHAQARMPQALSSSHAQALRAKYQGRGQALGAELQHVEGRQQNEEGAIRRRLGAIRQDLDNAEAGPKAAAGRELQTIQGRRDQAVTLSKREEGRIVEVAKADFEVLDKRAEELRRVALGLQWERVRAAVRVKAYTPVTFGHYLRYVAFGSRSAG